MDHLTEDQRALLRQPVALVEEQAIRLALAECRSVTAVSARLGIGRSTLYRKLQELGIRVEDTKALRNQLLASVEATRMAEQRAFPSRMDRNPLQQAL